MTGVQTCALPIKCGLLDEMETAPDKKGFSASYQLFIASAADHITILAPFFTPLAELVQKLAS